MGSDESRTILNLYLDLALLKNKKTAYQDFFVQVAISLWGADFEPRKPQGSLGDKKCDGYRVSEKAVFQVYAPEKFDAKDGNKKILEDFEGAKKHFGQEMKKWIFVHNSPEGLPTETDELIKSLRTANPTIAIEAWSPEHLRVKVLALSTSALRALFPNAPTGKSLRKIPLKELNQLVRNLDKVPADPKLDSPIAPSRQKIDHNQLTPATVEFLKQGSIAARQVEKYFSETSRAGAGDRIAEYFRSAYRRRKADSEPNQKIFFGLLELAGGLDSSEPHASAVLGLVAYLFHCCDIFEDAPQAVSA